MSPGASAIVLLINAAAGVAVLALAVRYFRLWTRSHASGAGISLVDLITMTLRRVNPAVIVDARAVAARAGIAHEFSVRDMQAHYLAGGNVAKVVNALIVAKAAGIPLSWDEAAARDLAAGKILPDGLRYPAGAPVRKAGRDTKPTV